MLSHHLLLTITLRPSSEKYKFLYLRGQRVPKLYFPKFESRECLGEKFYIFNSLGIQIEIDFHPKNTRIKLHSFRALKS